VLGCGVWVVRVEGWDAAFAGPPSSNALQLVVLNHQGEQVTVAGETQGEASLSMVA
jgi:hypothetical protein